MLENIDTVLFDLDGTLTVPVIDFAALRRALDVPDGESITHALNARPEDERERGFKIVEQAELKAAHNARANTGAIELIAWLHGAGYATGIITRNNPEAATLTLDALGLVIDVVITRDCAPPKPAPDPVHEALRRLGRGAETTLVVGDYRDDIEAGKAAGALTCLVTNGDDNAPDCGPDLRVSCPQDLLELFQRLPKRGK